MSTNNLMEVNVSKTVLMVHPIMLHLLIIKEKKYVQIKMIHALNLVKIVLIILIFIEMKTLMNVWQVAHKMNLKE